MVGQGLLTGPPSYKWKQFNDTVCLSKIPGILSPSHVPRNTSRTSTGRHSGWKYNRVNTTNSYISVQSVYRLTMIVCWSQRVGGEKLANYNSIDQLRWPQQCLETQLIIAEIGMNWVYTCPTPRVQSIIKTALNNHINFSRAARIVAARRALDKADSKRFLHAGFKRSTLFSNS